MHRAFTITIPDTNYHQLYALMLAQTNAIPAGSYLPNRVCDLRIQASLSNGSGTITVTDAINMNAGVALYAGDPYVKSVVLNGICLNEYGVLASAANLVFSVDIEGK